VVWDSKYADIKETQPRAYYIPYRQSKRQNDLFFYLRTAIEPQQVAGQIRREVAALDPNLPIRDLKTMQNQIEENIFAERLLSLLTTFSYRNPFARTSTKIVRPFHFRLSIAPGSGRRRSFCRSPRVVSTASPPTLKRLRAGLSPFFARSNRTVTSPSISLV
jgi:hypothetical protein